VEVAATVPAVTAEPTAPLSVVSTAVATNTATATLTQLPPATVVTPTSIPSTNTPSPPPTPDPYAALTIPMLRAREYGGGLLEIVDTLEQNEQFTRYHIRYPSDGLAIHGYMNVPNDGDNFPVVLMLHGYIDPDVYDLVPYTERYATSLAEAGFFVIHPNFRNYPPSDSGSNPYRIGYAADVLNLIAIIRAQSADPTGFLRRVDPDRIYLWGHSMGGGVALRVAAVNREPYLRGVVLYASMSGDERLNFNRILEWSGGETGTFELAADEEAMAAISPVTYLEDLTVPLAVHHSEADEVVPFAWSEQLCTQLAALAKPHQCYTYYLVPHTFRGNADELFMERVIEFYTTR